MQRPRERWKVGAATAATAQPGGTEAYTLCKAHMRKPLGGISLQSECVTPGATDTQTPECYTWHQFLGDSNVGAVLLWFLAAYLIKL